MKAFATWRDKGYGGDKGILNVLEAVRPSAVCTVIVTSSPGYGVQFHMQATVTLEPVGKA